MLMTSSEGKPQQSVPPMYNATCGLRIVSVYDIMSMFDVSVIM